MIGLEVGAGVRNQSLVGRVIGSLDADDMRDQQRHMAMNIFDQIGFNVGRPRDQDGFGIGKNSRDAAKIVMILGGMA